MSYIHHSYIFASLSPFLGVCCTCTDSHGCSCVRRELILLLLPYVEWAEAKAEPISLLLTVKIFPSEIFTCLHKSLPYYYHLDIVKPPVNTSRRKSYFLHSPTTSIHTHHSCPLRSPQQGRLFRWDLPLSRDF